MNRILWEFRSIKVKYGNEQGKNNFTPSLSLGLNHFSQDLDWFSSLVRPDLVVV